MKILALAVLLVPAVARAQPSMEAGAALRVAVGLGPAPAFGASALLRHRRGAASFGLEAIGFVPGVAAGIGGVPVRVGFLGGAVVPCVHVGPAFGCAVLLIGPVTHDSPRAAATRATFLTAPGLRFGVRIPLGPFAVETTVDAWHGIAPRVTRLDDRTVWASTWLGSVSAGLVVGL